MTRQMQRGSPRTAWRPQRDPKPKDRSGSISGRIFDRRPPSESLRRGESKGGNERRDYW